MDDHPGVSTPWDDPRTGQRNALVKVTRQFGLRAWLIAKHRLSAAIVYLKNIVWGFHFIVKVNSARRSGANAGPGMRAPASGDGQGAGTPVVSGPVYNTVVNDPSSRTTVAGATRSAAPR